MTIQEAIKSGKPYRRKGWQRYQEVRRESQEVTALIKDLLADDWEIQSMKVKKTIVFYANVYPIRKTHVYDSEAEADVQAREDRIACVKLVGEYEVEE